MIIIRKKNEIACEELKATQQSKNFETKWYGEIKDQHKQEISIIEASKLVYKKQELKILLLTCYLLANCTY